MIGLIFSQKFHLFLGMTRRYKGLNTLLDAKISDRNFVIAGAGEEKINLWLDVSGKNF